MPRTIPLTSQSILLWTLSLNHITQCLLRCHTQSNSFCSATTRECLRLKELTKLLDCIQSQKHILPKTANHGLSHGRVVGNAPQVEEVTELPDPCPLPSAIKRRGLNDKDRLIYAPMADVGGLLFDKDAMYIDIPDWKVCMCHLIADGAFERTSREAAQVYFEPDIACFALCATA